MELTATLLLILSHTTVCLLACLLASGLLAGCPAGVLACGLRLNVATVLLLVRRGKSTSVWGRGYQITGTLLVVFLSNTAAGGQTHAFPCLGACLTVPPCHGPCYGGNYSTASQKYLRVYQWYFHPHDCCGALLILLSPHSLPLGVDEDPSLLRIY